MSVRAAIGCFLLLSVFSLNYANKKSETDCWTAWSPCTVSCINQTGPRFDQQWRINQCDNETRPEIRPCEDKVPQCLHSMTDYVTQVRASVYFAVILVCASTIVVPSAAIWVRYTKDYFFRCRGGLNSVSPSLGTEYFLNQ
ncbi:hypothetical protein QR680_004552 [Steinernema hermaphroditum]|uniref:FZ domain-containing protein n=1 Tax=Steinernema hermaphroditum TaxID=289476 RepID=A0AA39HP43_9BILA|nr:hypothetical protein QR680_004552 [Steinernema hermaphroditum]